MEYDTDGAVVYNGLSDSLRYNNIETAVFDNKIVAPKVQSFFKEFLRLKTITDIANLDTSSATSFKNMFSSCGSLETLDVSSLNTSNATDMESMFQWCNTLTSLDVSNLDTSKVTNMVSMFNSCKKIEELDLSSFKTSNVKSMAAMFTNCEELTTIKTTVDFVVDQVTDLTYNNLFEGNTKLVGGQGTTYDASKLKKEYARIDEGPTNPGYFTGTIPPTPSKKVSSFVVKTNPSKTTYLSGDAFDPTGLVITVTYDDSTKADIDYDSHKSDFSFNPTTITASGDVVVTYGGKTATVAVTVAEVGDIYIIEAPDKTVYRAGQYFDPTGLVIQVVGDAEPIAYDKNKDLFTFEPSLTTALTTANKSVKVMFDGKSTTQAITVTNPTPTPTPPGGGGTGGSSSGDSNPEKGPMGDLTKNPMYQQQLQNQQLNTTNNIPQTSLLTDTALISTLQSYSQNQYMIKTNARDQYGNTGFGQWQHVPGTQTWYFLSGDLNSNGTTGTVGLLTNGWYNLGWDGQDKWYHFDANGVMGLGWYQEGGKTYYLETNPYDNWYGKAVTGQQIIDGQVYNFDASGALIA